MDRGGGLRRLRRLALREGGRHVSAILAVYAVLLQIWPGKTAFQWLLQAIAVLGFIHYRLHHHLSGNHSPGAKELFTSLGAANRITLARGWAISCIAGLIFLPDAAVSGGPSWLAWGPGILYLVAGLADFVDGFWARRTSTESILGQHLDMEMDALGLLAASILAVWLRHLPTFYLTVGASYYLFRLGIHRRRRKGGTVLPLQDRPLARISASFNMGFVGLILLPVLAAEVASLAALCLALPLLLGFAWDWLLVSGRLSASNADRLRKTITSAAGITVLGLRLVLLLCGLILVRGGWPELSAGVTPAIVTLWAMMVLGWLGRSAALVSSGWLAMTLTTGPIPLLFRVALSATLVLMILGTGPCSFWRPEDTLLSRKAGARSAP